LKSKRNGGRKGKFRTFGAGMKGERVLNSRESKRGDRYVGEGRGIRTPGRNYCRINERETFMIDRLEGRI